MSQSTLLLALIPAYEPSRLLPKLVNELKQNGFIVVVVDDGSGSTYQALFEETANFATVIAHPANQGKGRALKTGLSYIRKTYLQPAAIVTLDADGQHSVADTMRVCQMAAQQSNTLVLGCRAFSGNVPCKSRFGNSITRLVYKLATGHCVSDTQTGLRAFATELIPLLCSIPGDRYEYEMNVLLACARRGIAMKEVPIETIYYDNNSASHFLAVSDSVRIYREILKFAASSLTGFLVDYSLYGLLVVLTQGLGSGLSIPLSNVTARIVSASVNYTINKRLVFQSKTGVAKSAVQYAALAACILAGNTMLLSVLVNDAGMNRFAAKLLTEFTVFTASWFAQKCFIFRKKKA